MSELLQLLELTKSIGSEYSGEVAIVSTCLVLLTQIATVIEKPKFISAFKTISVLWDVATGNRGKAKNAE